MGGRNALWMILVALPAALGLSALPLRTLELSELGQALESAASLAVASQRVVLEEIGQALSAATAADRCNIFGRGGSCVEVVSDGTPFCGSESSRKIDCAFKDEAFGAVQGDPLKKIFEEETLSCSECENAMKNFWCGLTLPSCGTFEPVVDELLPVVASVATKKAFPLDVLQIAIPRIFQAAALGFPCRKMCEAITSTCECGRSPTFGEIVTSLEKSPKRSLFNMTISPSSAKELFIGLWHKPVCHIFSDENTPGFRGICKTPLESSKCEWCGDRGQPRVFYNQIVVQLSQMFYGIMEGGLHPVLNAAAGEGEKTLPENWSESLSRCESKASQARHTGVVLLLFLLLVLAVAAFFAAVRSHRHRQVPSQYIDLHSLGYTPPML